jgi:hypothetical protein
METIVSEPRETDHVEVRSARRPAGRISENVSVALGIMWVVGYLAVGALEPATHHDLPTIAIVLSVAFHLVLLGAAAGLVARRRWGIGASIGASAIFLAGTIACPTTGHHAIGLWWLGQMVVSLALVAASVAALVLSDARSSRPSSERAG